MLRGMAQLLLVPLAVADIGERGDDSITVLDGDDLEPTLTAPLLDATLVTERQLRLHDACPVMEEPFGLDAGNVLQKRLSHEGSRALGQQVLCLLVQEALS